MLQILDQRWRDHLSDMDYLRDGIHLRQIAQQDPLTAWQKEGYLMFEALLGNVDADFVRYITHVERPPSRNRPKRTRDSRAPSPTPRSWRPASPNFRPRSGEEGTAQTG